MRSMEGHMCYQAHYVSCNVWLVLIGYLGPLVVDCTVANCLLTYDVAVVEWNASTCCCVMIRSWSYCLIKKCRITYLFVL